MFSSAILPLMLLHFLTPARVSPRSTRTCIGTPYYMSPEIFKNKPYNHKSDIWALGCVLYEMTTLNHAFDANSLNGLASKIIKGRYPPIHPNFSANLRSLISAVLSVSPASRPNLEIILQKPFVKKHVLRFFADVSSRSEAGFAQSSNGNGGGRQQQQQQQQ